ncbi:MAG: DNA alkylation repair protein [Bacteroidales bacterium]|nr:DNA alkylation repair protein [Bacteroidales bacterium]MCF8405314.1 DNA alkylation repair protein [Bacteroidales bacterium]
MDCYGAYIVGYAWRENIISTAKVKSYINSNDFWIRRIALVATVSLNQKARGGTGAAERTLEICELFVKDHTDMINKALSWALRELAKIDPIPVIEFMNKHRAELHKRVSREVDHKLKTGTKN